MPSSCKKCVSLHWFSENFGLAERRLHLLTMAGLPLKILDVIERVMDNMTRPDVATWQDCLAQQVRGRCYLAISASSKPLTILEGLHVVEKFAGVKTICSAFRQASAQ